MKNRIILSAFVDIFSSLSFKTFDNESNNLSLDSIRKKAYIVGSVIILLRCCTILLEYVYYVSTYVPTGVCRVTPRAAISRLIKLKKLLITIFIINNKRYRMLSFQL